MTGCIYDSSVLVCDGVNMMFEDFFANFFFFACCAVRVYFLWVHAPKNTVITHHPKKQRPVLALGQFLGHRTRLSYAWHYTWRAEGGSWD